MNLHPEGKTQIDYCLHDYPEQTYFDVVKNRYGG